MIVSPIFTISQREEVRRGDEIRWVRGDDGYRSIASPSLRGGDSVTVSIFQVHLKAEDTR